MPARTITIAGLGDFRQLQTELERTGVISDKSATTMANSSKRAGLAAAEQAKQAGASADQQVAAAGRAAAAYEKSQARMSAAAKAASRSAAEAGKAAGLSADQQEAAAKRAAAAQDTHAKISKVGGVVALGVAGAAVEAVKLGMAYQTAGAAIQGATGQSAKSIGQLKGAFDTLGTGAQAAVGSGMQMEAAYAAVAGQLKLTEGHALSAAEATKFSAAANNLAEGTGIGLASAYAAVAKTMQTFHLSASQAGEVSDTLYSTSKALGVPVEQVAAGMGKLHARLGDVAPSLKDTAGLMTLVGEHGLTGGRGVMVVNTAFQTLLGGSKKTDDVLKALGVSVYDSNGKFIGMQSVISQLQPKLAGLTEHQRRFAEATLFGKGATEVMNQAIKGGVPAWEQATSAGQRHGAVLKAAEAQSKTASDEMKALGNTVKTLGGDLGLILIPDLQKVATVLMDGIKWLEKHKAACIALGAVVTGVLGTAVAVFAYDKAVAFGKGVQRMVTGLGSLVTSSSSTAAAVEADQAAQAAAVEANAAKMEAANATAGASFTAVGTEAAAGETAVGGAVAGEAAAVGKADTAIEGENVAAGASFKAMLPEIAAVAFVLQGLPGLIKAAKEGTPSGDSPSVLTEGYAPGSKYNLSTGGSEMGYFMSKGLTAAQAAGIEGNIMQESSGNPNAPGGGLFQDIGGRGAGQGASAKKQLEKAWEELQGPEHATLQELKKTHTPEEAARIFSGSAASGKGFERPGTPEIAKREKYAREAFAAHPQAAQTQSAHAQKAMAEAKTHTPSHTSNAALQEQLEEQSGQKPKKKKGAKAKAEPYVAPLAHPQITREDMGLDFAAHPGEQIKSIGKGIIKTIISNWYKGQPLIEEELTQGAHKGQDVYYAEQLRSKVHEGQHVAAGQSIATVAPTGTGLEFGYAAGHGRTLAQATTGFKDKEGNDPTTASKAYAKFMESVGKSGSVLNAVAVAQQAATNAEAKRLTAIEASAKKMLGETTSRQSLSSAIQSGTVSQLEKVLGVSTAGSTGSRLSHVLSGYSGRELTPASLEHTVMPTLAKSAEASGTGKAFDKLISELKAVHTAGTARMVTALEQAHKQALADLGRELYAVTQEKQAQQITNSATEEKDRNTEQANLASKQLQIVKDQSTQQTDAMTAAAKQIDDATQIIKDSFAEMVEAVSLATQKMADAASGEVTKTQDQTATKIAELAERGKYGLDLIAQKLEVQLDQMKSTYDVQIQQAKMALDQAKISGQALIAEKQLGMDLLQAHEDSLIGVAQAHTDAIQVAADQQEAAAQSQVDAAQIASDARADATYLASVLVAGGTKAQQDAAKGMQAWATASGQAMMTVAEGHLKTVEAGANVAIQNSQAALAQAQAQGTAEIAGAQQALAQAEGSAKIAIANAEQGLTSIEDTAKVAEAALEGKIAITREEASTQYMGSGLTVNQYGIGYDNAAANANELTWALTHQLPV